MRNDILLRRGILKNGSIQYLEYLESTGTQYIDTGILTNDKQVIKLKICVLGGVGGAFGYRWNGGVGDSNQLLVSSNNLNVCIAYGESAMQARYNKNTIYNIEFNPVTKKVWVNGELDYNSRNISLAYNNSSSVFNVTLFGANLKGNMNIIQSRIYSYSVYEEGECIIDLVPISICGVGYMLDKVTNKVFSNAGTGDFILGPDI